ncbi:MAG: hypothetical protein K2X66_09865 [Cyanobacteria bacterium]|nr:hypothetical protein [Cyanobacteriota bacterium]
MTKPGPLKLQNLTQMSQIDVKSLLNKAFSNTLSISSGIPAQVFYVQEIRSRLCLKGEVSEANDLLLKERLTHHLNVEKRFGEVWLQPNPDLEELLEVWEDQTDSVNRWVEFVRTFKCFGNLPVSMAHVFNDSDTKESRFPDENAKKLWVSTLWNEHQEIVGGQHKREIRLMADQFELEGNTLYCGSVSVHLENSHARLIEILMDGKPKTLHYLLKELFGVQSLSPEQVNKLSRRVSELNKNLSTLLGKPQGKRWINRIQAKGEWSYQLCKPFIAL